MGETLYGGKRGGYCKGVVLDIELSETFNGEFRWYIMNQLVESEFVPRLFHALFLDCLKTVCILSWYSLYTVSRLFLNCL